MNKFFSVIFLILLFFSTLNIQAQSLKAQELKKMRITGTLKCSEDNQPIVGATIIIKGTTNGVAADFDGNFTIVANKGDFLLVSSIGYLSQEIKIGNQIKLDLILSPDKVSLKEIAVIGYGVQERRDLTGAVSSVNIEQIEQVALSVDNALAGQIAGVQVNSASGAPGSATAITIRGITSLGGNNNPLYIIDGVPVYGVGAGASTSFDSGSIAAVSIGGNSTSGSIGSVSEFERNPLASLNMDDIESIEVLKDAYATAIYGSRGAAGVIIITTKKGKKGLPKVNIDISTQVANPIGIPDVLSGDQYVDFYNSYKGPNKAGVYPFKKGYNTDWFNAATRTAVTNKVSATVSAGTDKSTYFLSLAYLDQDSYVVNNDFKRYTARINYEYKTSEKFRFGNNISLSYTDNNALNSGSVYRNSLLASPNTRIKNDHDEYVFVESARNRFNPVAKAREDVNFVKDKRVIGNLYAEYKALSWLTLRTELGIDLMSSKAYNRNKEYKGFADGKNFEIIQGSASQSNINNFKLVINNTASIYKEFGEHVLTGVLGQSFETSQEDFVRISATDFPTNDVYSISAANEPSVDAAILREWALVSFFGRLQYRLFDKYIAGFTYRVDGSSRFNKNQRYVGFPSFSVGWRISEENFMERYTWLDEMKLRASLGFSGIAGSGRGYYGNQGQYIAKQYAKKYGNTNILEVKQPSNPDLKWEKTHTIDLGLDLSLLNSKISLTLDYYNKKSINMLIDSSVPFYSGYGSQEQNLVDMVNEGFEVSLNTVNIDKEFKWISNFNFAKNTNEITKLNLKGYVAGDASMAYAYFQVGQSATSWFLYDWHGVDPLTGNPLWRYSDGSISQIPPGSIDDNEKYENKFVMGDRLPEFTGGFTNIFSYKNFEINTLLSFSYGGKIMNGTRAELLTYSDNKNRNLSAEILDEWIISGHRTKIPKKINESNKTGRDFTVSRISDRFLEDGSFIRLKNISLSYRFNADKIRKFGLGSLVVYAKGSNLLTWTNYSGPDPEVSAFGSSATYAGNDELTIPQQKAIQIGVKIGLR